jgi:glycosyltransferase involved in cell wall biosynthesis
MLALADQLCIQHAVDWVPFTRDVASEIRQMDLLVLPSLLPEGLPMVLLEAMSAGVPIVGSGVDGVVDVIEHEGNGLLATPGNVQELAQQLRRVLTAEVSWDDLRTAGLQKFQQHFTDRVMAHRIAQIYDDLVCVDSSPAASAASTGKRPRPSVRSGQTSTDSTRSRTASP